MKHVKHTLLLFALVSLSIFVSCGPGDDGDDAKTAKEEMTEALVGTWAATSASDASNVTGSPDVTTFTVSFSATSDGLAFAFAGDIASYVSGGSFSVSEEGAISSTVVSSASTDLSATLASGPSVNATYTEVKMTINVTESSSRVGGIGTYNLTFNKQ